MAAIGQDLLGDGEFEALIGLGAERQCRLESGNRISQRQSLLDAAGLMRHQRRLARDEAQELILESGAGAFQQEGRMAHQRHQPGRRHIGATRFLRQAALMGEPVEDQGTGIGAVHGRARRFQMGEPGEAMQVDEESGLEHQLLENAGGAARNRVAGQDETVAVDLAAEIGIAEDQGDDRPGEPRGAPAAQQAPAEILSFLKGMKRSTKARTQGAEQFETGLKGAQHGVVRRARFWDGWGSSPIGER